MPQRDFPVRSTISAAFAILLAACSGFDGNPAPYAPGDCIGNTCGAGMLGNKLPTMGGSTGTTADGGVGAGAGLVGTGGGLFPAAANCSSEFGVTLCLSTPGCPGIVLDASQFPSCGFVTTGSSVGVQCVCNGSQLCPLGAVASCADLPNLLQQQSITGICNQATVTGICRDLGTGLASGSVNATTCNRNCAATCDNTPVCLAACGC